MVEWSIWTEEKVLALVEGRRAGYSFAIVGRMIGMNSQQCRDKYRKVAHLTPEEIAFVEHRKLSARLPWSDTEDTKMLALFHKGYSIVAISGEIGRSRDAVTQRLKKTHGLDPSLQARGGKVLPALRTPPKVRKITDPVKDLALSREIKLRQANVLHLIDLKRAGHSASRTELMIPATGGKYMPMVRFEGSSVTGSAAALCAE